MVTRRNVLAATAAGAVVTAVSTARAATFGNPDAPPEGAVNARNPASLTDPGPQNPGIAGQFPSSFSPPATDVGGMPMFWSSFNNMHRRIQNGGWAREVTQADFAISKDISGVNMRLTAGGIREMHWHTQAEWAYMSYGNCRITVLDPEGRPYVADLKEGDLWYFPAGFPHSLQGTGKDGCEFVICFDDGMASEFNTLLLTDWLAHTPPDVLAQNFGVPASSLSNIPLDNLWIFQGKEPGDLAADQASIVGPAGAPPYPFTFSLGSSAPARETKGGYVQIADSSNFTVAKTVAAALVTVRPGGLREMHWHPNADEWQYWVKGKGQMTVFNTGPRARTLDFNAGDVGYVPKSHGHVIKNVGDTDLVFLEVFKSDRFADISLSDWLTRTPRSLVSQHLNVEESVIAQFPSDRPVVVPD
jgi:oxalate decarboxylase